MRWPIVGDGGYIDDGKTERFGRNGWRGIWMCIYVYSSGSADFS